MTRPSLHCSSTGPNLVHPTTPQVRPNWVTAYPEQVSIHSISRFVLSNSVPSSSTLPMYHQPFSLPFSYQQSQLTIANSSPRSFQNQNSAPQNINPSLHPLTLQCNTPAPPVSSSTSCPPCSPSATASANPASTPAAKSCTSRLTSPTRRNPSRRPPRRPLPPREDDHELQQQYVHDHQQWHCQQTHHRHRPRRLAKRLRLRHPPRRPLHPRLPLRLPLPPPPRSRTATPISPPTRPSCGTR